MSRPRNSSDDLIDAFKREGIVFERRTIQASSQWYWLSTQTPTGWHVELSADENGGMFDDTEQPNNFVLTIDPPTGLRLMLARYVDVRMEYAAANFGPLLRTLCGYEATMRSTGGGSYVYGIRTGTAWHAVRAHSIVAAHALMRGLGYNTGADTMLCDFPIEMSE